MIWSLQILRFIAAMMIVFLHVSYSAINATGSAGVIPLDLRVTCPAGVDIFFVLSGAVIATTAPGMTPLQFLWRRIRRIYPIYLVACAPWLIQAGLGWRDVLASLLLWPATDVMTAPTLVVAWTLSFEMLFYISAALVLRDRRWLYALCALYATAFLLRPYGPLFQFLGNPLIIEFLLGVVIAKIRQWPGSAIFCVSLGFVALSLAGLMHKAPEEGAVIDNLTGEENLYRVLVWGLPSALIVFGFMQIKVKESVWTRLGDASYSLYLFHTLPAFVLFAIWSQFPAPPDVIVAVGLVASILFSWRIHVLVEAPILRAIPKQIGATIKKS